MGKMQSFHQLKFLHSYPLIGSELIFVENRNGPIGRPHGYNNGQTPLGMGMVLYIYVVSHNARNAGTVSCIRLYHTADAKTTAENLKDIIHMDSSVLVLSLAAKYEQQILDNVPKGAALHKLLGVTLYFSPQRAVLEPPPSYEPLAQNQSETPVNTSGMRDRNDSNDLTAYNGTIVPGPSVQVIPGPSEQIIPGPSIQVIPEHQPGQQVLQGPVDSVQGPVYYQGQSYFGTPYPYINPQSLNPNDPNLVPNFPPISLPTYGQYPECPPPLPSLPTRPETSGLLDELFEDILPL